jgi:hypothetical protein
MEGHSGPVHADSSRPVAKTGTPTFVEEAFIGLSGRALWVAALKGSLERADGVLN